MTARRREWLAVAGAALVAGTAGYAVWRRSDAGDPAADAAALALRSRRFESPDGSTWSPADFAGKSLVINFWATWCPPCLREMPALERFQRAHGARGWQVLGLAADGAPVVRDYLRRAPVSFPVGMLGLDGIELSRQLGNTVGGLPFTLVLDPAGRVKARKLGETDDAQLARWAEEKH